MNKPKRLLAWTKRYAVSADRVLNGGPTRMLLPVYRAGLSHSKIVNDVERGNPVSPPQRAGETARHAAGDAGVRCRKKRKPSCNGMDTG